MGVDPLADDLYLDKAFNNLRRMTAPSECGEDARPAYRMFEGWVHSRNGGMEWDPWLRAIAPYEVPAIAEDLDTISEADFVPHYTRSDGSSADDHASELDHVMQYLTEARRFVRRVEAAGCGFVYSIA